MEGMTIRMCLVVFGREQLSRSHDPREKVNTFETFLLNSLQLDNDWFQPGTLRCLLFITSAVALRAPYINIIGMLLYNGNFNSLT